MRIHHIRPVARSNTGIALIVAAALFPAVITAQSQWNTYSADNGNTKYSSASEIKKDNVGELEIAWRWTSPDNAVVADRSDLRLGLFKGTPVLHGDALYIATGLHQVVSIDPRSGETRWTYDPEIYERGTPQRVGFIHRGVSAWRDRIFHTTGEGYLTALSSETGDPRMPRLPDRPQHGRDLHRHRVRRLLHAHHRRRQARPREARHQVAPESRLPSHLAQQPQQLIFLRCRIRRLRLRHDRRHHPHPVVGQRG